jgi:hypothetical protein
MFMSPTAQCELEQPSRKFVILRKIPHIMASTNQNGAGGRPGRNRMRVADSEK